MVNFKATLRLQLQHSALLDQVPEAHMTIYFQAVSQVSRRVFLFFFSEDHLIRSAKPLQLLQIVSLACRD